MKMILVTAAIFLGIVWAVANVTETFGKNLKAQNVAAQWIR